MPELTRRRALLAVASGAATLAGCGGSETDRVTIDDRRDRDPIDDYEVASVRNEDGAALFTEGDGPPAGTDTDRPNRYRRRSRSVVVSTDGLDAITFGDVPAADRLRTFAEETDLETSSLYLASHPVDACHAIRLQSVSVEWDGPDDIHPDAQFCRTTRPADVACSTGTVHTAGFVIRLPVAAERSSGSGGGMSSSCGHGPSSRGEHFDGDVTPASGGENS